MSTSLRGYFRYSFTRASTIPFTEAAIRPHGQAQGTAGAVYIMVRVYNLIARAISPSPSHVATTIPLD